MRLIIVDLRVGPDLPHIVDKLLGGIIKALLELLLDCEEGHRAHHEVGVIRGAVIDGVDRAEKDVRALVVHNIPNDRLARPVEPVLPDFPVRHGHWLGVYNLQRRQ